jgi:hypothetical protein
MGKSQIGIQMGHANSFLNIYVSKVFQWYKECFNPMSFDPWNTFLKIWNYLGILTPKMEVHLEVCGSIPSHSQECKMWLSGCTLSLHLSMHLLWSWTQG